MDDGRIQGELNALNAAVLQVLSSEQKFLGGGVRKHRDGNTQKRKHLSAVDHEIRSLI